MTILTGDFNFKVDTSTDQFMNIYKKDKNCYCDFIHIDEFVLAKDYIPILNRFHELPPTFPPTFKYILGKKEFNLIKGCPSWTDRIFFNF